MRKAMFAVMLVAASFAGGAVVNGPGLRWAQGMILSKLGMDGESGNDNESDHDGDTDADASLTSSPKLASNAKADVNGRSSAEETVSARPIPPLVLDTSTAKRASETTARPTGRSTTKTARTDSSSSQLPGLAPVPEGAPPLESVPPVEIPPATSTSPARAENTPIADTADDRDPAIRRVSLTDVPNTVAMPTPSPAPAPLSVAATAPPVVAPGMSDPSPDPAASSVSVPNDWTEVRNTLRALGVSRYGIEGEPAGRVRFHCVIPLAGRRAVGQHFEGEGNDELQAARAALKRVALWRATEGATPSQ